ncbi:hypothetical protein [Wolbachia endosymbiont of Folsomia candida]|uniref:hypothetical protein n=1 Tax=Wolbachia endosymbiont of Folsomia candida TaxID=169402 RepID=UPI000A8756D2|nr:hypothetical protein [Wolbachia endosymbiont of Folsomia candida]APR98146.1 hypothetical protein ASM33_02430 [Wolbachia endosymbiont of Folsomia candida]
MTDFIDFFNSHGQDFFNDGDYYTISQYSVDNNGSEHTTTYSMKYDTCGLKDLSFGNWSEMSSGGETHIIMFLPDSPEMEEIMCDKELNHCDLNNYTLDGGALSLDGKEVTFNMIPKENNPSKEFDTISIRRV